MKRIVILGASIFILGCQTQGWSQSMYTRFNTCDSETVFVSVLRSEKLAVYFPPRYFGKYYDKSNHAILNIPFLIKDIDSFYNKAKDTGDVLRRINAWCEVSKFINPLGEMNPDYPMEAILYYTDETKRLVEKYIKSSGQTGTSLSTCQLYELDIDFLNYIDDLKSDGQQKLLLSLKQTANHYAAMPGSRYPDDKAVDKTDKNEKR